MKKKNLCAVLSALLVLAVILTSFTVPSFARRKLGDVDGDGTISAADARKALRASVKLDELTEEEFLAANVESDAFITAADARTILRASVKLETLPEIFIGDDTEEETTEPEPELTTEPEKTTEPEETTETQATPTDATPTDATPSDPETTTEPEPSDPETTTEPEQTDPSQEIIPPEADNEYEILRSGNYHFKGNTVDGSGKSEIEIARTPNSLYLGSKFEKIRIGIMTIGNQVYLVNPDKKTYLDLNTPLMKAELKALDIDVNEFANTASFDFAFFPPLDDATRTEDVPGGYVRYVFESPEGAINVTMDGKKLMSLENARDGSVYRIDFTSVSSEVPSERSSLSSLQERTQILFVASLM